MEAVAPVRGMDRFANRDCKKTSPQTMSGISHYQADGELRDELSVCHDSRSVKEEKPEVKEDAFDF